MPRSVHVSGSSDGLREALVERLERAGAELVDEPEEAEVTIQIDGQEKCDIAIIPRGSQPPESAIVIELSDVIIPNGGRKWGNDVMTDWVNQILNGKKPVPESIIRFWVNVRDVVDAISTICLNKEEKISNGKYRMCGRRAWEMGDVTDEIRVLWERYNNSINHSHTIESLSEVPSPVRGIHSEVGERPDLSSLHEVLIRSGGDGWHPLVPMRVSLMEMIASAK
jgi:nucleoside-diphosphate-sugar epimerase